MSHDPADVERHLAGRIPAKVPRNSLLGELSEKLNGVSLDGLRDFKIKECSREQLMSLRLRGIPQHAKSFFVVADDSGREVSFYLSMHYPQR